MKSIEFHGHSLESIRKFPLTVKREIGYQLDRVQRGLNPVDWKPMPTVGKGVKARKTARVDINQAQNALKRAI